MIGYGDIGKVKPTADPLPEYCCTLPKAVTVNPVLFSAERNPACSNGKMKLYAPVPMSVTYECRVVLIELVLSQIVERMLHW